MKPLITLCYACLLTLCSHAQHNTTVHAVIKDLAPGQWVYYNAMMNSLQKDSVQTTAGGFTIHLQIPDFYMINTITFFKDRFLKTFPNDLFFVCFPVPEDTARYYQGYYNQK